MRRLCLLALGVCLLAVGSGSTVSASQYKGIISGDELAQMIQNERSRRVVLLNFWATWCFPCHREMPALVKLRKEYASENLLIIGLSMDYNKNAVPGFIKEFKLNFPVYISGSGVGERFEVTGIPKMMFYDEKGLFMERAGYMPLKMIRRIIEKAISD